MSSQSNTVFLFCLLTGTACAMFYTKGSDSDYPRIGRRSFYTSGGGNHYPRIGRRNVASGTDILFPNRAVAGFSDFPLKRGIFTQSQYGAYPRVGRRSEEAEAAGAQEELQEAQAKVLQKLTGMDAAVEASDESEGSEAEERMAEDTMIGLELMFMSFDLNGDQTLSKSEFTSGMENFRRHNQLC